MAYWTEVDVPHEAIGFGWWPRSKLCWLKNKSLRLLCLAGLAGILTTSAFSVSTGQFTCGSCTFTCESSGRRGVLYGCYGDCSAYCSFFACDMDP